MKPVIFVCLVMLWASGGCRGTEPQGAPRPELVHISSLPTLDPYVHRDRFSLNVLFCIMPDGGVSDVRVLGSSGDARWDAAAVDSMKQWRFTGVAPDSPPEGLWIRQTIVVRAEERVVMSLGEVTVEGKEEAESLYALLSEGVPLDSLLQGGGAASGASVAILGPVDIARYPGRVRDRLRNLDLYDVTRPIRVGGRYVIYQRLDRAALPGRQR